MTTLADKPPVETSPPRCGFTVWGLDPPALHDRYWASRGVQVVRAGIPAGIDRSAELFLLVDPQTLVLFDLENWLDLLNWTKPDLLVLRLGARQDARYREVFTANEQGDFVEFNRVYRSQRLVTHRVGLTCERELAEVWESSRGAAAGWRHLRRAIASAYRETRSAPARIYRQSQEEEVARFVEDLATIWGHPGSTIARARNVGPRTWADIDARIEPGSRIIGPAWIGAGRRIAPGESVIGPAALADDPEKRPVPEAIRWRDIEPTPDVDRPGRRIELTSLQRAAKRAFDVVFALVALGLTLPLYPLVMLAILIEDGRPFFFAHERETLGGRVFRCLKFRSMRKDSEHLKAQLAARNQADGPQFFMEDDPRLTRVGRFIRKTNIDELPQFINVLLGHMSIVGPRPSPHAENQYCPEWREARLSVRPGITGLWQVRRTRLRGCDFQEWIKYDIQYVDNMSLRLDLRLIWQTIVVLIRRAVRS